MEWHDASCHRLDLAPEGEIKFCLSCGSHEELRPPDDDASPAVIYTPSPSPQYCAADGEGTPPLHHPPLRRHSETRILVLQGGKLEDPICGDLRIIDLDLASSEQHRYEALSYTWADESGDATPCRTIQLGGRPFLITANCENALRRVRREFVARDVWVDAICIDQHNLGERGRQVRLMPKIYSGAQAVLIYVGEAADRSARLFFDIASGADLRPDGDAGRCIESFFRRRYFQRIWVLQEVALARKAELICGDSRVPWLLFKTRLERCCPRIYARVPVLRFGHQTYTDPSQLLDMLELASQCRCQDPRDKVFALLGLLPYTLGRAVVPDYGRSVEQVYAELAVYIAAEFSWAQLLRIAVLRRPPPPPPPPPATTMANTTTDRDWPSWVPDWRCAPALDYETYYQNCPLFPIEPPRFSLSGLSLKVTAWKMPHVPGYRIRNQYYQHRPHRIPGRLQGYYRPPPPPPPPTTAAPPREEKTARYYLNLGEPFHHSSSRPTLMAFDHGDVLHSESEWAFFDLLAPSSSCRTGGPTPSTDGRRRRRRHGDQPRRRGQPAPSPSSSDPSRRGACFQRPLHIAAVDLQADLRAAPAKWKKIIASMVKWVAPGLVATGSSASSVEETLEILTFTASKLAPIDEKAEALWPVPEAMDPGKETTVVT
ncbi:uncharacterized protein PG986_004253 [Apiospora aurea]|uniref:Heterokaryon incompatibility domain-containing protein n=1 Tax=Apiospora aurea TaxID=335848 RepID=A0ABR1QM25_9PEZI